MTYTPPAPYKSKMKSHPAGQVLGGMGSGFASALALMAKTDPNGLKGLFDKWKDKFNTPSPDQFTPNQNFTPWTLDQQNSISTPSMPSQQFSQASAQTPWADQSGQSSQANDFAQSSSQFSQSDPWAQPQSSLGDYSFDQNNAWSLPQSGQNDPWTMSSQDTSPWYNKDWLGAGSSGFSGGE